MARPFAQSALAVAPAAPAAAAPSEATTPAQHAEILAANIHQLPQRHRAFAESLITKARGLRAVSPGVAKWLRIMAQRATNPAGAAPQAFKGDGFQQLAALFERARSRGSKRPRVDVRIGDLGITLRLAGAESKNPGHLYVFNAGEYAGKISPAGEWHARPDAAPELTPALARFARNPAKAASEHGRLHGNCCFCRLPLSDPRSAAVGYGEICAERYGLPYGEQRATLAPVLPDKPAKRRAKRTAA